MKLSVVLIVKNEESCLRECLESVKAADEIIVLDTGSTDKTCKIAREYTPYVFEREYYWKDDFSEARNYALQKATGDWILSIDADEVLLDSIETLKKHIQDGTDIIYNITMVSTTMKAHYLPRVFMRCKEIFWCGAVHEVPCQPAGKSIPITIMYGYSKAHENDPDLDLRILLNSIERNPNLVREKYYLAREYYYRKQYDEAIRWWENYISNGVWLPEMADASLMLARCYWLLHNGQKARYYCLQAIGMLPDFKEALLFMAEISFEDEAKIWKKYAQHSTNEKVLFIR